MTPTIEISRLKLQPEARLRDIEQVWLDAGAAWSADPECLIDMSACEFIELAGLIFIISKLVERRQDNLHTSIRLPDDQAVRRFLLETNFAGAVEDALNVSFRTLVTGNGEAYGGGASARALRSLSWGPAPTVPHTQFSIQTFFAGSREFGYTLAGEQARRWQEPYILSMLNRELSGRGPLIATHVVHEAMMNLVQHPRARIAQTAAQYGYREAGRRYLVIVFWDDGESIADTVTGASITQDVPVELHRDFAVRVTEQGGGAGRELSFNSAGWNKFSQLHRDVAVLAAVLPGVTGPLARDVAGDGTSPLRGLGLYVLTNAVLDVLGGRLSIRTDSVAVDLVAEDTNGSPGLPPMRVEVTKYPPGAGTLCGNLLVARIPLSG